MWPDCCSDSGASDGGGGQLLLDCPHGRNGDGDEASISGDDGGGVWSETDAESVTLNWVMGILFSGCSKLCSDSCWRTTIRSSWNDSLSEVIVHSDAASSDCSVLCLE